MKKSAKLIVVSLAAALLLYAPGCGDDRTVTVSQPEGLEDAMPRVYDTSPESTGQLIRDTSTTVKANSSENMGVHFIMDSRTAIGDTTIVSRGEGDMVFPDRVKMTTQNYTDAQSIPVEVIVVGGKIYTRSTATNQIWKSSGSGVSAPDPKSITSLFDFARSSRNFGEESLPGNRKTYHVQLDVDAALAADEAKKQNSDPALIQALEATRNASITVDLWIGTNDLLVYQERVVVSNPATALKSDQTFMFSGWGKSVEIVKPCESC
ncbi:MAG: LppX_LprAFG lipoprotein [Thermoleophilia bacterium]